MATRTTRETGYIWMKAHFDELTAGDGDIFFTSNLPQNLNGFCTVERAEELARDMLPRFSGKDGELEMRRAIERVRNCAVARRALAGPVSHFLLGQ